MSDKMRQEFEAAYAEKYARKPQNWSGTAEKYFDAHANGAWWAWQASRSALCVELPSAIEYTGCNLAIEDCRDAIHAAGVKTK